MSCITRMLCVVGRLIQYVLFVQYELLAPKSRRTRSMNIMTDEVSACVRRYAICIAQLCLCIEAIFSNDLIMLDLLLV